MATIETLMLRTVKSGDCLEFTGHICKSGYGLIWHDGKNRSAHRVSFELHNLPIMDGQLVMHTCDNRKCINPDHLILGSHKDNMKDKETKDRGNHPRGERHHRAVLSAEVVCQIKARFRPRDRKNGPSAIARDLGLSVSTVGHVIRGYTWTA